MRDDFTVQLERVFRGPMDLLLHLVREQEVEIHEVQIHTVITGYFEYLKKLEDLDIEVAGDFLVMASTLMAIKSRSLLPREEVELEDELDPEDELIQRLLEYRRFKGASEDLETRFYNRQLEHERGFQPELSEHTVEPTLDLGEVTAWDLLSTFSRLLRETLANRPMHVRGESRPLRWYVSNLGSRIRSQRSMSLRALLLEIDEAPTREDLIGVFCALLELMRIGVVTAHQEDQASEIEVRLREDAEGDLDYLIGASQFMDEESPAGEGDPEGEGDESLEEADPEHGSEPLATTEPVHSETTGGGTIGPAR